jgi:hypothetical protein
MAILCRDIGLLLLQAPHTGSTSLGTLLRTELGGEMLVEERIRDARGRIVLRQKHQTLAQLMDAGLVTPEQRANLLVVVGIRNPFDLVLTEYARNRDAGSISAPQRLLRRLPGASPDFSPRDFERFVQRRYVPSRPRLPSGLHRARTSHREPRLCPRTEPTRLFVRGLRPANRLSAETGCYTGRLHVRPPETWVTPTFYCDHGRNERTKGGDA